MFDDIEALPLAEMPPATNAARPETRLRFREDLGAAGILDGAFTRRDSDTLIVTLHGALDRSRVTIPRFERVRSTEPFGTSCLFWADPSLWLDEEMGLSWFTGAGALDLLALIAERSVRVADAVNAERLIFTGSSGGGFAALQLSALVPQSTAMVFNPQTAIFKYWAPVQRKYLRVVLPNVLPVPVDDYDFSDDWSSPLSDRFSAVRRYSVPRENRVFYWTNTNDAHHRIHRKPFVAAARSAGNDIVVNAYDGPSGHHTPTAKRFDSAMRQCLESALRR